MLRSLLLAFALFSLACGRHDKLPPPAVVRACETLTACGRTYGLLPSLTDCVSQYSAPATAFAQAGNSLVGPTELACLGRVGDDCDAAAACVNLGAPQTDCTNTSASSTYSSSCDGTIERVCLNGRTFAFDCAESGLVCVTGTDGNGACGLHACAPDFVACVDDTTLATCSAGVETRQDCSVDGQGCVTEGSSGACLNVGAGCDPSAPFCDGDVMVSCDGHTNRIDCGARGLRCVVHANDTAECVNGSACDDTVPATCDAASGALSYCYLGTPLVADCRADGFSGCDAMGCLP